MSRNAVTHGLTAVLDGANVGAWLDVITCEGAIAPKDCPEAVALAEAEVRLRAAVTHWRYALSEAGKPFEATETSQQFDAMISQIRDISNVTGEPIDREGLRLLKSIEREALKAREGPLRDLRLASRYLAEALSERRRRLEDWIAYLEAISRNDDISPIGGAGVRAQEPDGLGNISSHAKSSTTERLSLKKPTQLDLGPSLFCTFVCSKNHQKCQ